MQYRNAAFAASVTIAFVDGALVGTAAYAEDTGWCPKPGTVVKGISKGSDSTGAPSWTALGSDPEDATVCRSVDRTHGGPSADGSNVSRQLFNWVRLNGVSIFTSDSIDRMREAWRVILSGQTDEITSDRTNRWRGQPVAVVSATNTLTRQGQEELLIGGQAVSTVRLNRTYRRTYSALDSAPVANSWELWYAPELRIFVKGQFTGIAGIYNEAAIPPPPDFEATSVQGPQSAVGSLLPCAN